MNVSFLPIARSEVLKLTATRPGERKLGEGVQVVADVENPDDALRNSTAPFVLIGLPEDIGVRANGGVGGANTAWRPALESLLAVQDTASLRGENILLLGELILSTDSLSDNDSTLPKLRQQVSKIDEVVSEIAEKVIASGKILLAIGGGHNNAYGLLRGASKALASPLNAVNLDAHSDYRVLEGRHSGNPFRYAKTEGALNKYAVIGLHESYNSEAIMADLREDESIHFSTYEDIFLSQKQSWEDALSAAFSHVKGTGVGVELDLDCIEGVLSSAATPCGISSVQARRYLHRCATELSACYLHLPEGATELADGRTDWRTPKLIAYLLTDFMRAWLQAHEQRQ